MSLGGTGKLLFVLIWGCGAFFWALVCWKARPLSARYNQWTTGLRNRSRSLAAPPTPRMLEVNTRIMTWIIRVAAIWFGLFSLLVLASTLLRR